MRPVMTAEVQPASAVLAPRRPALWIVLALLVAGAVRTGLLGARFATVYPRATALAVLLFALLAVPFWWFVAELAFLEREPIVLRLPAVGWGALVATTVSIPAS